MSSWVALRQRVSFQAGQDVLVLGATGNAGQLAVQVARHLGADQIIAAGRDTGRLAALPALGATATVPLGASDTADRLAKAAADVDVVLDYLWGPPTTDAMVAIITNRSDRGKPLSWIEIGSVAGPTAEIPSAALRAARLQLVGSGQGSVSTREYLAELDVLAREIAAGTIDADARAVPLARVEEAWAATDAKQRIVLVP
jgi:NADPH:quinone reductase-like Zn-dependent oxidoreductase